MPYFGMAGIKSELMAILDAPIPQTILSDGRTLNYDKMLVMGILNITPDSFYAGSACAAVGTGSGKGRRNA